MKISIGCDHRGFELKNLIIKKCPDITLESGTKEDIKWSDMGCLSRQRCDYPPFAKKVVDSILNKDSEFGLLICGSGIGMTIAANRFKYIYAGLCHTPEMTTIARSDDKLNILTLSADFLSEEENLKVVVAMLKAWAAPTFKRGRYQERLDMVDSF